MKKLLINCTFRYNTHIVSSIHRQPTAQMAVIINIPQNPKPEEIKQRTLDILGLLNYKGIKEESLRYTAQQFTP